MVNIVIADPTQVDLVSWIVLSCGVAAIVTVQAKEGFYHDQFLVDMFFLLDVEVFGCLH